MKFPMKLLLVLVAASFVACSSADAPTPLENSRAGLESVKPVSNKKSIAEAFDAPITRMDGSTFRLADFKGKVVMVDFWATYCPPCVKQIPQLAELSKRYKDKGLEIVGLTTDEKTDQQKVEDFIKRLGINYTIGYANNWLSSAFLKGSEDDTGAPPIPQLFIISRDGKVVDHQVGDSPDRGVPYLEKIINRELSAK
ncbi:MAG: TlpA family protein disulfide reductase [Acidobacteria bacterium]|nr:TlpA family protein disulfide reductase [Acidobacteriota bacterium]